MSDLIKRLRSLQPEDSGYADLGREAAEKLERYETALRAIAREQSSPSAQLMADQFQLIARDAIAANK